MQVFEEALKTWSEKQKLERPISARQNTLTEEESNILQSFVEATEVLIKRYYILYSVQVYFME